MMDEAASTGAAGSVDPESAATPGTPGPASAGVVDFEHTAPGHTVPESWPPESWARGQAEASSRAPEPHRASTATAVVDDDDVTPFLGIPAQGGEVDLRGVGARTGVGAGVAGVGVGVGRGAGAGAGVDVDGVPGGRGPATVLPAVGADDTWARAPASRRGPTAVGPAAGIAITIVGAVYIAWRAGTLGGTGVVGHLFYAAEVTSYLAIVWTAVMASRMRRGYVRRAPAPTGTLDVFVTVCGEPVDIVERTLRAAMAIDYPHRTYVLNDGRIARRDNWRDIDALAARLGLHCFTRIDGPRGKAANLNYALARTSGDAIMTLDADHVAFPDLAERVLGYLRAPGVGFVCTEQRFDLGRYDVLNNAEPMLYRAIQPAKDADSAASSCGNGTMYRRAALDSVGGFSEWNIIEDLHTSYELHAAGWRSVYHPDAVSVGIAPATAAEYAKQRSRWSMDGLRLLLFDNPLRKRGLTGWQRAHYLHSSVGYLIACAQMVFLAGPPLSVLAGIQIASGTSLTDYVLHAMPYLLGSLLFIVAYIGPRGAHRTVASTLFNAPLYAMAFVRVVLAGRPEGGATAKAALPRMSVLLLPQMLFAAALVATFAGFAFDPDVADLSAVVWAGVLLSMVAGPMSALSERREAVERAQVPIRVAIIAIVLVLSTLALIVA